MLGYIPSHKQTGKQSASRQEYLTRKEVEPVEYRLSAKDQPVAGVAIRQRTEHANDRAQQRDDNRTLGTRYLQLLVEEGGANLVERHQRGEGCQRQEGVEQQRHNLAHQRHRRESLLEHVGQCDEYQSGTRILTGQLWVGQLVGSIRIAGEEGGEYHQTCQDGDERVDADNLHSRLREMCVALEIAGIGAQTAHAQTQRVKGLSQCSQ